MIQAASPVVQVTLPLVSCATCCVNQKPSWRTSKHKIRLLLQVLHRNIQEALRLFPPLIIVMRYVKETFSVTDSKGRQFVIPKVI